VGVKRGIAGAVATGLAVGNANVGDAVDEEDGVADGSKEWESDWSW